MPNKTPPNPNSAPAPDNNPGLQRQTQVGLAEHIATHHASALKFVSDESLWLTWSATGWTPDLTGNRTHQLIIEALRGLEPADAEGLDYRRELENRKVRRWLRSQESLTSLSAIQKLLSKEPRISITGNQLNTHPDLLGTPNGNVNLKSGELREPLPSELITQRVSVAYNPEATCPRWQQFLRETISEEPEVLQYIQTMAGYCLTGHTTVQQMWLLIGHGANGKSTFLNTLTELFGAYAETAADTVLLATSRHSGSSNDIAALQGRRLVTLSEADDGRTLNEVRVKQLVSGDRISARKLYQDYQPFTPVAKYFLAANHLPGVRGTDHGIWRRLVVIPFDRQFDVDPTLTGELRAELPGILNWAVKGAATWYEGGKKLTPPGAFKRRTTEYRVEHDHLGRFLVEHTVRGVESRVTASDLRDAYTVFCRDESVIPLSPNEVGSRLRREGYRRIRHGNANRHHWSGLRLATDQAEEET